MMTAEDVKRLECNACPGPGGCGGMYTANTMACYEVLGMSLPGSSSHPAESADKKEDIEAAGRAVVKMLELGLKPSDILTREALKMPSLQLCSQWFYKCHSHLLHCPCCQC